MYDDNRLLEIPFSDDKRVRWRQRKYLRERLLCNHCDNNIIGAWESHAKRLIFGGNIKASFEKDHEDYYRIRNVDYVKFKLFQMSLLWRAGVSKLRFFSQVELGEHKERLRSMLLAGNPGEPYEYGCMLMAPLLEGQLLDLICEPEAFHIHGHRCYRFVAGGFVWVFVVSSHAKSFVYRELFLTADGRLVVVRENAENIEFLRRDAEKLRQRLPEIQRLRSERN